VLRQTSFRGAFGLAALLNLSALVSWSRGADAPAVEAAPVVVSVDFHETPDLEPWAEKAKALAEHWYPILAEHLKSDGFTPPAQVKLIFKAEQKGVAGTAKSTIFISADYVRKHPEDLGMLIHELTHVVQAYSKPGHGWLVEGIADYTRFFIYEPETRLPPINPDKASYRDSYKTAAGFLNWASQTYDKTLVSKINAALRKSEYKDELFQEITGRPLDQLWSEYVATLKKA
jgi:hypothetical protein